MKKIVSILLTIVMLFSFAVPAFAADNININESKSQIPIVRISGDGEPLYDNKGNKLLTYSNVLGVFDSNEDGDNSNLYQSIANVILPFLVDGLLSDNWDPYYNALYTEIAELFGNTLLDNNGDPIDESGLSESRKQYLTKTMNTDKKGSKGYYALDDYMFYYDWRLDPTAIADDFNAYIKAIKLATGAPKVSIVASCLGTSIVMAYLAEYGYSDIHGIGFDGTVCNGSEIISESISGKFRLEGDSLTRVLEDCNYFGVFDMDEFTLATIDLLSKSGAIEGITTTVEKTIYEKLVKGVTSALALSTFCTWPGYWATVSEADYDDAMLYVFGEAGSQKRKDYAGLIEKIENYNTAVRGKTYKLFTDAKTAGVNVGIMAKYGYQIIPICQSSDEIADELVTIRKSSFGATTTKIYEAFTDDYLASVPASGLKYISPDRQIDASTCLFPDYTWFIKGASHADWTKMEMKILYDVVSADKQLTVNDTELSQFMVYDNDKKETYKMTEENCDTYVWSDSSSSKPATSLFEKLSSFLNSLFKWFRLLFQKFDFSALLGGNKESAV